MTLASGCDSNDLDTAESATFTVTVENVSQPGTIDSERAMGTVPLSPGAWVVFTGDNPAFTEGTAAAGTEADTPPGTGPNQKPAQDPTATDVGPEDEVDRVEPARDRHPGFSIPANSAVIRVSITSQQ